MMRKPMAKALAIALATSTVSLIASPAVAAGQNPYDTFDAAVGAPANAIVGVGSDTTQIVVHALTDEWNLTHTPKLASFAADGLPENVKLRTSSAGTITRASVNGSGNGKKLLYAPLNNPEVNFARSSSTLDGTETSAGLQQAAFAVDGLKMAVSTSTHAPASLTPQQVVDIYKGVITNWSQVGGTAGVIKPYHPQTGSGTFKFFKGKLDEINGGAITFAGTVGVTQEHSAAEIQNDPNAIAPFSTARASGINSIKLLSGTEWKRAVYNVVRGSDTTESNIVAAFGKNGFLCSAEGRAVIEEIGFVPLATEAQGGKCGVWTQAAVTDFTSFDDAGATTTSLAGSASGSTVTLTATIGGSTTDGSVTFKEGGSQVGSPKMVAAGKATLVLSGVPAGKHFYTAHFEPEDPQLAGPSASTSFAVTVSNGGSFVGVSPARLLDTRSGIGAAKVQVGAGKSVTFQVAGKGGVPASGASAAVLNLTVTKGSKAGVITAFPAGIAKPNASNISFAAGQTIATHATVKLGTGGSAGKVTLFNSSTAPVDLIADVLGWYRAGAASGGGMFTPVVPARLANLVSAGANGTVPVAVAGKAGVPASGVGGAAFNVTVTGPTGGGYITAFPNGTARPNASNVNFLPGQTIANAATVKLVDGKLALFNGSAGTTKLTTDVSGWFKAGAATAAGAFTSVTPARILDTRNGIGATKAQVPAGGTVTLTVAGKGGVPASGAGSAVLNVTVTKGTAGGYVTAFPTGTTKPNASNINFVAGQTIPNLVTVKLGSGKVTFFNGSTKPVDVLADVAGWYRS